MIDFIKGKIEHIGEDYLVIENNSIGYKVFTSAYTTSDLNGKSENAIVYTQMIVREDDIRLCGFSSRAELKVFDLLRTVKGVGTKVALGILSSIPYVQLVNILMSGDANSLTKAPGIGKKTAQRIILELKDKVNKTDEFKAIDSISFDDTPAFIGSVNDEAVEALVSLGYSKAEAQNVLRSIDENLSIEEKIKQALKLLVRL
ncbi:Holliday junction branch migration protein RuvA [Wukongibacter sp. M2B1]|uniref:Holliday junction branch migration protein RuvA n=1 Tax=Wukongibacter sp. M2B1 TaxID=3088895 RepID=UPI003D7B4543